MRNTYSVPLTKKAKTKRPKKKKDKLKHLLIESERQWKESDDGFKPIYPILSPPPKILLSYSHAVDDTQLYEPLYHNVSAEERTPPPQTAIQQPPAGAAQDTAPQATGREAPQLLPPQQPVSAVQAVSLQAAKQEALPRSTPEMKKANAIATAALRSDSSAETSALSLPPPPSPISQPPESIAPQANGAPPPPPLPPPPAVAQTVAPKAAKQEEPQAKSTLEDQIKSPKLKKAKFTQNSDTKAAVEDTQILTPEIYKKLESADYTALSRFIDAEKKSEDPSLKPTQQQQPDEKQVESEIDHEITLKETSGVYEVKSSETLGKVKFVKDSQDSGKIDEICNKIFKQIGVPYIIFGNPAGEIIVVLKYGGGLTTDEQTAKFLGTAAEKSYSSKEGGSCILNMINELDSLYCCTMTNPKVLLFLKDYFTVRTAWHENSHNNQAGQLSEETARNLLKLNGKGIFPMDLHNILFNENNMNETILECVPPKNLEKGYCRIKLMNGKTYFVRLQYNEDLAKANRDAGADAIQKNLKKLELILQEAKQNQFPFLKQVFMGAAKTLAEIAGLEKSQQIESVEIIENGNWVSYRENLSAVYVPGMITSDIINYILNYINSVLSTVYTKAQQKFGELKAPKVATKTDLKQATDDSEQDAIEFAQKLQEEWTQKVIPRLEMAPQQDGPEHDMAPQQNLPEPPQSPSSPSMRPWMISWGRGLSPVPLSADNGDSEMEDAQKSASPPRLDTPPVEDVCDVVKGLSHPSERLNELLNNKSDKIIEENFEIGSASGNGNNCLLYSLYQLIFGKKEADENDPEALKTVTGWRTELNVGEGNQIDAVDPVVFRFIEAKVRLKIVVVDEGLIKDIIPVGSDESKKLVYILRTGRSMDEGHFVPLWPKDEKEQTNVRKRDSEESEKHKA
ncbi:hypothetical protein [Caproicibacter sp.]|uniref:hypothetical protein n=1 Tax=Caproicibacter sp. TaxID=2814884 RepID=UPI003988F474